MNYRVQLVKIVLVMIDLVITLLKPNNSLRIDWVDEHHVKITYRARQNPEPYTEIIEY